MEAQQAQPGRLANGAVLNKVLGFDIIRQLKNTAASGDVDTVGCYDRITPTSYDIVQEARNPKINRSNDNNGPE